MKTTRDYRNNRRVHDYIDQRNRELYTTMLEISKSQEAPKDRMTLWSMVVKSSPSELWMSDERATRLILDALHRGVYPRSESRRRMTLWLVEQYRKQCGTGVDVTVSHFVKFILPGLQIPEFFLTADAARRSVIKTGFMA